MMNYESFFEEIKKNKIDIKFDDETRHVPVLLSNEALFHLPFLAITILLLSKNSKKPKLDEIGQLIGECLESSMIGFKGTSQHLGWSANLRIRTVRALSFLEISKLVEIDKSKKTINATQLGHKVIKRALESDSDLSYTLNVINRIYRNINVERKLKMGIS